MHKIYYGSHAREKNENWLKSNRLIVGASYEKPYNGMYSFFPCHPSTDEKTYKRPEIDSSLHDEISSSIQSAGKYIVGSGGYGYYLASREFDVSEIRLLADSIYGNPSISDLHSAQLIKKLQKLLPSGKRRQYKNLSVANVGRKTDNKEVFLNIDYLDEAITKRKKVAFTYLKYDFDKKLRPRRKP